MTDNNLQNNENEEVVPVEASAPVVKKEKEVPKKQGMFAKFGKFIKETRSEVKKVVWPTKSQIVNNTLVVIVMIAIVGAFIGLLDLGFTKGLELLLALVAG